MADTQEVKTSETTATDKLKEVRANYGTTRVLKMVFICDGGRKLTWNLKYPRADLTKVEVINGFMQDAITEDFILYNGHEASEAEDAYIYETRTIEINN